MDLPAPVGPAPYRLPLSAVLPAAGLDAVRRAGRLRFHCVGDTGGLHNPIPQRAVAAAMQTECEGEHPVRFFFHLGDIVYLHGEREHYGPQFFDPYSGYRAPILGIAGNHDGDRPPGDRTSALAGFAEQFCAPPEVGGPWPERPAQHQPNVYWTLRHEWLTMIGLYTGVPEGGHVDAAQLRWLQGELRDAPLDAALILAMHHPVFSADAQHGSNLTLRDALDGCFARAGRTPDAVFSAHAHNYQRFTRLHNGRGVPYVVAGSGGFHELHRLGHGVPDTPAAFAGLPDLTLEAHQHGAFGFLTVNAGPDGATAVYNMVVRRRPVSFDSFAIRPAV